MRRAKLFLGRTLALPPGRLSLPGLGFLYSSDLALTTTTTTTRPGQSLKNTSEKNMAIFFHEYLKSTKL